MAVRFPSPSELQARYFQILKSIKPSINVNDINSDFVIRGRAFAGFASGFTGDAEKVNRDTWVNSARPEALLLHGADLGIGLQPATPSQTTGFRISGVNGTVINPGDLTVLYVPTGTLYSNTTGGVIAMGFLTVSLVSQTTGQIGNVRAPDTMQIVSPPGGVNTSGDLLVSLTDGSNIETFDSYRARLLSRKQSPPAGGNQTDYPNFAFAADPSVRSVFINRFGRGLGTVDVYITTGTTDIDTAVTQGLAILRIPGAPVLATVQEYYDANVPLTDCASVYAPTEVPINVSLKYSLAAGVTLGSVPSDPVFNPLSLTTQQLIVREVSRALYKIPVGGRRIGGSLNGFVVAADIEASLDVWLSSATDPLSGSVLGRIPILSDREVEPLDTPNYNRALVQNQLPTPGVITLIAGV